jgi:Protein of unknown function (DUF3995)
MIRLLAIALNVVLVAIAGLHLYWGFGGFWPGHDNDSLVGMVVGLGPGNPVPPLWACVIVVFCLMVPVIALSLLAFGRSDSLPRYLAWLPSTALWACVFVFVARGAATYGGIFDNTKGTAFHDLNTMIYSPLCLALGLGLAIVWFGRPRSAHSRR